MDNLTHTAVGLFLSRAGLKNWTPLATPILILASNLPDMDIAYLAGGSLNYLHYHRHWTHALASIPLMALIAVAVVRLAGRRPVAWMKAWIAGMIAVAIHVLLDLTNIYGVRPLLPFSDRWLHLDWTNVIDLWIWAVCLLATLGPFIGRLVGSEISSGAVKDRHHGRGLAWFALTFLVLYNGGRSLLHGRALSVLDSRLYQDVQPIRVAAGPDGINPLRWFGLAETPDFWVAADVNLAGEFDPTRA